MNTISSTALLSIKTDKDTKAALQAFARELGMTTTALANGLFKQAIRDQKVVFSLEPTAYLEDVMREVDEDLKTGRKVMKPMNKTQALSHLDSLMSK
jgi:antitoxin component of RelBE/YafQ-DinJ toxin-antitoxin module